MIEALFNIFAPHNCVGCGTEGSLLCESCVHALPQIPPRCYLCGRLSPEFSTCSKCRSKTPLLGVRAGTVYDGVAKELIHRLKYERVRAGAKTIARLLADGYVANDEIITHVPTAGERVRARGYDQADLIARELSKQAGIPYLSLLNRLGKERQVGQKRADRKLQMKGAFYVRRQPLLVGKSVLLVDDVLTTGATCEAAARALKRAGARSVSAIVFAAV